MTELTTRDTLEYLARSFGGTLRQPEGDDEPVAVALESEGVELVVSARREFSGAVRLTVDSGGLIPAGVRIRGETWLSRLTEWLGQEDFQVGDAEVDGSLLIDGTLEELVVLLRPGLLQAVAEGLEEFDLEIEDGELQARIQGADEGGRGVVGAEEVVRLGIALCRGAEAGTSFEALAETLASSPSAALKRGAYNLLLRDHATDPRLEEIDRKVLRSSDRTAALRAARRLGEVALPVLENMVLSPTVDRDDRMAALVEIGQLRQTERGRAFLLSCLATEDRWLTQATGHVVLQTGDSGWITELVDSIPMLAAPWFSNLLTSLVALPGLNVDEQMASSLPSLETKTRQLAMLSVLGRIGSLGVIETIEDWAASPQGRHLADEADEAIARIRRRGDIDPKAVGALSILEDLEEAGGLSVAGTDGQVSLSEDEPES